MKRKIAVADAAEIFTFPEHYSRDDIDRSIKSISVVRYNEQRVSWRQTTITLDLNGEEKVVTAQDFVGALYVHKIQPDVSAKLLTLHGLGVNTMQIVSQASLHRQMVKRAERAKKQAITLSPDERSKERITAATLDGSERASLEIKMRLREDLKLTDEEFAHLPSFAFLVQTAQAMMFSSIHDLMIDSAKEMERQQKSAVEITDPAILVKYAVCNDISDIFTRLADMPVGSKSIPQSSREVSIASSYRDILIQLIEFRRGKRRSDQCMIQLDGRLRSYGQAFSVTPFDLSRIFPDLPESQAGGAAPPSPAPAS